jgi:pyridoxamine 5'-phosphate oxidase
LIRRPTHRYGPLAVPSDPIARFHRWFREAGRARLPLPEAMALGTTGRGGVPSVRFVLLKRADARGFVLFTDRRSAKGRDLDRNARAALVFHWHLLGRQVRIGGRVVPVSPAEADAYWRTRPRPSQLAALASRQSAPLPSRTWLMARWRRLRRQYRGRPIPRPPGWTGFRVVPHSIEFWTRRQHRLHHRELFVRTRRGWERRLLQP